MSIGVKYLYVYIKEIFANGPGDWGSIPGRVIPKTPKMVFDAALGLKQVFRAIGEHSNC